MDQDWAEVQKVFELEIQLGLNCQLGEVGRRVVQTDDQSFQGHQFHLLRQGNQLHLSCEHGRQVVDCVQRSSTQLSVREGF
jgi:hypothetical protein